MHVPRTAIPLAALLLALSLPAAAQAPAAWTQAAAGEDALRAGVAQEGAALVVLCPTQAGGPAGRIEARTPAGPVDGPALLVFDGRDSLSLPFAAGRFAAGSAQARGLFEQALVFLRSAREVELRAGGARHRLPLAGSSRALANCR
ncbi:hypothetical protein [Albimonas pacifica]|uniref:Uncharacterized protein n=1 Tax=Albimonas pacifica TaxID=1114924 RepID=A0A1I3IPY4_9RHOB|nr:hypothetical protein [Albimonas pacifica]SFI49833.1 hypothetical protein SAMN05216258_107162 [Albimonas pacifica]